MPTFKSTYNILKKCDEDEVYNDNWMDSDKLVLPPCDKWDYSREITIEDVDIWEVLYEASNGIGLYAAWQPYAEFYMVTTGIDSRYDARYINTIPYWDKKIVTYYGPGSQKKIQDIAKSLDIPLCKNEIWVEEDELWLYQDKINSDLVNNYRF